MFAFPFEGTELQWQEFGDDLSRLGIGPLWVKIENGGQETLDLLDLEWTLARGASKFSGLDEKAVLKRFHKNKNIRLYTLRTEERALYALKASALPKIRLGAGRSVEGFVFIKINATAESAWSQGSLLTARDVRLPDGSKISIPIHLRSHAQR